MSLAQQLTDQPPAGITIYSCSATGSSDGQTQFTYTSIQDAFSSAETNLGSYSGMTQSGSADAPAVDSATTTTNCYGDTYDSDGAVTGGPYYGVDIYAIQYLFVVYSATCYVKVEWNVLEYLVGGGSTPIKTTPMSWEWSAPAYPGGLCMIAEGPTALDNTTTDFCSPTYTLLADAPSITDTTDPNAQQNYVQIGNVRYSYVQGYEPPVDGSANGWPAPASP